MADDMVETDLLVVGGGCAGCWAALRAADFTPRVTVVDKGIVGRSGTTPFCHDMLGPVPAGEEEAWIKEMVEHTEYLSDPSYLAVLIEEERERIQELESWGVPFERDASGRFFLSLGRGHERCRGILCDFKKMMEIMRERLIHKGVKLVERVAVTDLLTSDGAHPTGGRVIGAVGLNTRTGQWVVFKAKAVMLSTGIISTKLHAAYADNLTGDGQAMAFRAGAELANLEFIFAPRFAAINKGQLVLASLMPFQTQGAYILNGLGQRFMEQYAPQLGEQRAGMGLLALAASKEIMEGRGPLCFDMRHFAPEKLDRLMRVLPLRLGALYWAGLAPEKEPIESKVVVLYFGTGGGIRMGLNGQASLPGLFAGGIASQFPGGSEVLSGVTLSICNVFGYRAGQEAGLLARAQSPCQLDEGQVKSLQELALAPARQDKGLKPQEIFRRLASMLVQPQYSIFKTESRINQMLEEIRSVRQELLPQVSGRDVHELIKASEARNFLDVLEPIFLASLARKESRLAHYRCEYPFRDDLDWLKWVVIKRDEDGVKVGFDSVPLEPPSRERFPAKVASPRM